MGLGGIFFVLGDFNNREAKKIVPNGNYYTKSFALVLRKHSSQIC